MSDNTRRSRAARTGALAQILAEEQIEKSDREPSSSLGQVPVSGTAPSPGRYYPTKGRAKVPPQVCRLWRYADRPEAEAVHATEMAESFTEDGQIAAVIVRCIHDPEQPDIRYEIICGHVRWRAALAATMDLEIDIRELDDRNAFRLMVKENELRRGLSNYATALRLRRVITEELYRDRTTLAQDTGLSPAQLSYYLGFAELPQEVVSGFKDITTISVRLGYALHRAIEQGFLDHVLAHLSEIEAGLISRDQIPAIWTQAEEEAAGPRLLTNRSASQAVRYTSADGTPLFSLRNSGESGPVLRFSKAIAQVLDESLWEEIQQRVEERLQHVQDFSTEKS